MNNKIISNTSILTGMRPGTTARKSNIDEIDKSFNGLYNKRFQQRDLKNRYMQLPAEYRDVQVIRDIDTLLCVDPRHFSAEKEKIEILLLKTEENVKVDIEKIRIALESSKSSLDDFTARKLRFVERFNGPINPDNLSQYKKIYNEIFEENVY